MSSWVSVTSVCKSPEGGRSNPRDSLWSDDRRLRPDPKSKGVAEGVTSPTVDRESTVLARGVVLRVGGVGSLLVRGPPDVQDIPDETVGGVGSGRYKGTSETRTRS